MPYLTPNSPPEDTHCYRLEIPNDVQWVSIVKGALSELIKAYNFEAFGDYSPEDTAYRFLQMYNDFVFQECDMGGCCYDIVESRVTDSGDMEISINGGDWQPNPADPRVTSPSLPPPIIDESHTKCDAATNGLQHLIDLNDAISGKLAVAGSALDLVIEVAALIALSLLAPAAAPFLIPLIVGAISVLFTFGQAAWDDYWDSTAYDIVLCALYCTIGEDGQFTDAQFAAFLAKIGSDLPASVARDTFYRNIVAMGRKGLNNDCAYGTSATADCSDCDCGTGCELNDWSIHNPVSGIFGQVDDVNFDDGYIDVSTTGVNTDGRYYVWIERSADNLCCQYVSSEHLSGDEVNQWAWADCGEDRSTPGHTGLISGQCANSIQIRFNNPGAVRIFLIECGL